MIYKNLSIIVALATNRAIGKDNQLLWHISDDLKRFKKLTTGNTVIMGRKTFMSLPFKPLPKRRNIVITRSHNFNYDDCIIVNKIDKVFDILDSENENFIIGGESIYKYFLPFTNKLYLTIINKDFEADTFFPEINFDEWIIIEEENFPDAILPYKNVTLERKIEE